MVRERSLVVRWARMGPNAGFWLVESKSMTSWPGTGSHVFLEGETADQMEKGMAGSCNRKSRGFRRRNRWLVWKNRSWAQGEWKPRRKRGLKVQSPILGRGVVLWSENNTKWINHVYCYTFVYNNWENGFPECSLMFNRGSPPLFLTSSYSSPLIVVTDPLL